MPPPTPVPKSYQWRWEAAEAEVLSLKAERDTLIDANLTREGRAKKAEDEVARLRLVVREAAGFVNGVGYSEYAAELHAALAGKKDGA